MNYQGILLKHRSDQASLGEGIRFCISHKFPGKSNAVGLGTVLGIELVVLKEQKGKKVDLRGIRRKSRATWPHFEVKEIRIKITR